MPLYEYYCKQCQAPFQARRSFSEYELPATCPHCGTPDGQRLISTIVAFSTDSSGARRTIAGGSACGSCGSAATGCSGGCSVRR